MIRSSNFISQQNHAYTLLAPSISLPYQSQQYGDIEPRLRLVNRFNVMVGLPDSTVGKLQRQFMTGQMTHEDMQAIVRLYKYTIDALEKKPCNA